MITETYFPSRAINPLGRSLGQAGVVGPPGVPAPSTNILDFLGDISSLMGLVEIGVYTPWAARESSISWTTVRQPPETNVSIAGLTDARLQAITSATFGQRLGWVAVLSDVLPEVQAPEVAFEGTPYEFFHTQAVYSQADTKAVPTIRYLHWGRLRDPGDNDGGSGSMAAVATRLHGTLVFAMQVNYDQTRSREVPGVSFESALAAQHGQLPTIPIVDSPPPATGPWPESPPDPEYTEPGIAPEPAPASATPWLPIVGAGLVCVGLGFVVVRAVQQRRKR